MKILTTLKRYIMDMFAGINDPLKLQLTMEEREEVLDEFKEICQSTPDHDMCKIHGAHYHCLDTAGAFKEMRFTEDEQADMLHFSNLKRRMVSYANRATILICKTRYHTT